MQEFPIEGVVTAVAVVGVVTTLVLLVCCSGGLLKTDD